MWNCVVRRKENNGLAPTCATIDYFVDYVV
jgi:hypothetical protein